MSNDCRPLLLIVGVYITGAAITLLSPLTGDPALYGALTKALIEEQSLIPKLSQALYLNKPPLLFWLNSLVVGLAKPQSIPEITVTYKLISILLGALIVVLTYRVARSVIDREAALWSALILALTHEFIHWSKTLRFESLYTLFIVLTYLSYKNYLEGRGNRWGVLSAIFIFLTFLSKGSFVIFSLIAAGSILIENFLKGKKFGLLHLLPLLGGSLLIIPFVLLYEKAAPGFIKTLFLNQTFERLTGKFGHQGELYYIKKLIKIYQPWLLPALIGTFLLIKRKVYSIPIFLAISLTVLTISSQKLARYLFFLYPFLSIAAGLAVAEGLRRLKVKPLKALNWVAAIAIFTSLLVGVAKGFGAEKHKELIKEVKKVCTTPKGELCIYYPWNAPVNREIDTLYLYCTGRIKYITEENLKECRWIAAQEGYKPKEQNLKKLFKGKYLTLYKLGEEK